MFHYLSLCDIITYEVKLMKKVFVILILVALWGCSASPVSARKQFDDLQRISFDELDEMLKNKVTGIFYFGWVEGCGDATNIQNNYFEKRLSDQPMLKDIIYVIDLDEHLPAGLSDKDARQPMIDAYDVSYSPTLIWVVDGVTVSKIEWTPLTSDPVTGISADVIDAFLGEAGY